MLKASDPEGFALFANGFAGASSLELVIVEAGAAGAPVVLNDGNDDELPELWKPVRRLGTASLRVVTFALEEAETSFSSSDDKPRFIVFMVVGW